MSWKRFWHRRDRDEDFAREIEAYIEHEVDRNLDAGMTPSDALAAARRKFGNISAIKERVHEMNSIGLVETFSQDLRHGWRWLRRNPGFSLVAVLSLALGIGANTAIFQLIDAVRLRTLPVPNAQELAEIRLAPPRARTGSFHGRRPEFTYPILERIRERQQSFSSLFAWSTTMFDLSSGGEARNADGLWVSGDFFDALHVPAERGRLFNATDDVRGCAAPGAVISHGFWQREFGGREGAIGDRVMLDGRPLQVIGVTPAAFFGMEVGRTFDVALPLCARALWPGDDPFTSRRTWWLAVGGRLKGNVTLEQAAADVKGISSGIFEETIDPKYTPNDIELYKHLRMTAQNLGTGVSGLRAQYETPLWILLVTTGLVLLIACANIANLMLARANARHREISIRLAIGASRGRLVRQMLTESILLSVLGAGLGLLLARSLSRFLIVFLSSESNRLALTLHTDWRILLYTAGLVAVTCLVFGLTPALRGTRIGPGAAMKATGRGLTLDRQRFGMRRAIVIGQVALSLVLLVGAVLFARSLRNLLNLESGFRPDGVLFVGVDLQRMKADPERRRVVYDQLFEALQKTPQVEVTSSVSNTPMVSAWNDNVRSSTQPDGKYTLSNFERVSSGYFQAVGTQLIVGRDFDRRDTLSSLKVAIVDEAFAEKVLQGREPIGARFQMEVRPGEPLPEYEVIGVVQNVKYSSLREEFMPTAYVADDQEKYTSEGKVFVIRSSGPVTALIPAVTESIRNVNPAIGIEFQSFKTIIGDSLLRDRLMATLTSFFGLLAAVLATIGLYGTLSYTVTQRRNEIGIRIALGAARNQVVRMILGEAFVLLAAGLILGTVATFFATRTAATLLFGLQPNDPLTIGASVILLGAITLAASYLPARRAAGLEPASVLREE
jgi:predicted permease